MYSGTAENLPYPDHSDYISLIRELQRELRHPIKTIWVKGHQGDTKAYKDLSQQAKLNIDADILATQYYLQGTKRPTTKLPHLPDQQITLFINRQQFPGHLKSNLRWHINGSYMNTYLQRRRGWSDTTWKTIDFDSFGGHFKSLTSSQQVSHTKFVHDLQPLGIQKARFASTTASSAAAELSKCPCCLSAQESAFHLLHCEKNPSRAQAIIDFSTNTVKKMDKCWGVTLLRDAIEQWLVDPTQDPDPSNYCSPQLQHLTYPEEKAHIVELAFAQQKAIGWHNAMRGYLTSIWAQLAGINRYNPDKINMQDGKGQIRHIIRDIYEVTKAIWKGRNKLVHNKADKTKYQTHNLESQEIIHLHSNGHLLPAGDRYLCLQDIHVILTSRPSTRRGWLIRARHARARQMNDHQHQTEITDIFPPTDPSLNTTLPFPPASNDLPIQPTIQQELPETSQTITRRQYHDRPPDTSTRPPATKNPNPNSYRAPRPT